MKPRIHRNPRFSWCSWPIAPVAIASLVATVAVVAPARAAILRTWNFDTDTRQLTVTLPSGVTPDFFLLAEPARIVLDMPNTTLDTTATAAQYDGAIRSIRLSDVPSGARAVIEFAPNTRLDPRHAELTATDLGNGQTQWTLQPLLQGPAVAPVATVPAQPTPPSASAPPATENPPATSPAAEGASASPDSTPEEAIAPIAADTSDPTTTDAPPIAPEARTPDTVVADPAEPETAIAPLPAPGDSAPSPDTASTDAAATEPASTPITVTPAPDLPAAVDNMAPALPALPAIAESATTGAAQALPSPEPLQGISTDASDLVGGNEQNLNDLPPEQLTLDPLAEPSDTAVSVPSLEETDRTPAPVATSPAAPPPTAPPAAEPPPVAPPAATDMPANQLPPPSRTANVPPPPAAPDSSTATPPPPVPEAIAANSLEIPPIPLPPANWRDRSADTVNANQLPPSSVEAIAQAPDATSPAAAQSSGAIPPPPPAPATASSPPSETSVEGNIPGTPPAPTAPPFLPSTPVEASSPVVALPPPAAAADEEASMPPPPTINENSDVVPFGAPLPQAKANEAVTSQQEYRYVSALPVGTRLNLQYVGANPLVLPEEAPVYEVLRVVGDVYDRATGRLLVPAGTQVLGRFEGFDNSGRRFVSQAMINGRDRVPLLAESEWLVGAPQIDESNVAIGSGIGAAAATVLTGLSPLGLVGGAAIGAAAGFAESPTLVTIEPGTTIEVEVVSEILPFNDAPDITRSAP